MTRCATCQRRLPPSGACELHGRPTAILESQTVDTGSQPEITAPPGWTLGRMIAQGGTALVYALEGTRGSAVFKRSRRGDRETHARFACEADVLRVLGPPCAPEFIDHGTIDGVPYLVMEHVPGETLGGWMSRTGGRASIGEIVTILMRIASSLVAIHDAGFVHRDVKPENIVLAANAARLLDFGLAKLGEGSLWELTQRGAVVGTMHYLAPEQLRSAKTDHRADLYALGVVAYEMVAGVTPFTGERRAIEYQHQTTPPPVFDPGRGVPEELSALIFACLAKQPDARPQTAAAVIAALTSASHWISTIKGVGRASGAIKPLGKHDELVLAWIEGVDLVAVARAITAANGIVARSRLASGSAVLAAFAATLHEQPLQAALATCRELIGSRCRAVIHATTGLIRRSAEGKLGVHGEDVAQVERWVPAVPFTGLVLTAAAAERAIHLARAAPDVPGYFREAGRSTAELAIEHALIGRDALVRDLVAAIRTGRPVMTGISGAAGIGKTRVLEACDAALRVSGVEVISIAGRRRFIGDHPDDERLIATLGGNSLAEGLAAAGARRAIVIVDDAQYFSVAVRRALVAEAGVTRVLASPLPMFETTLDDDDRSAIELPPLAHDHAIALLRSELRPAHLIPNVLLQRLALLGGGNPGMLVALARDIKRRGGLRQSPGNDEWYVATDSLDAAVTPNAAWLASRVIESIPVELVAVLQTCAALGPRFSLDEVEHVMETSNLGPQLVWLAHEGHLKERAGRYELADPRLQEAIYQQVEDASVLHGRALRYWLARRGANVVGWLARVAFHAERSGETLTAATCWTALAREARRRGEPEYAAELERRTLDLAPPTITDALRSLDGED